MREMFEAFVRRDLDAALALLHPKCEWRPAVTGRRAGRAEPYRGHAGVRRYFQDVDAVWDEFIVEPRDYRAVTGAVVIFGRVRGRIGEERTDVPVMWMWRLRDGLVYSGTVYAVEEPRG